jgi:hypothetical protein
MPLPPTELLVEDGTEPGTHTRSHRYNARQKALCVIGVHIGIEFVEYLLDGDCRNIGEAVAEEDSAEGHHQHIADQTAETFVGGFGDEQVGLVAVFVHFWDIDIRQIDLCLRVYYWGIIGRGMEKGRWRSVGKR